MPMKHSMSSRVANFRKYVRAPFLLRGTIKSDAISTGKRIELKERRNEPFPVYVVSPLYALHSADWVSKLHSTLHAAAARATQKCYSKSNRFRDISSSNLPVLMVFDGSWLGRTGRESFRRRRTIEKQSKQGIKFSTPFTPHRPRVELGVVHGVAKPTFSERHLGFAAK